MWYEFFRLTVAALASFLVLSTIIYEAVRVDVVALSLDRFLDTKLIKPRINQFKFVVYFDPVVDAL